MGVIFKQGQKDARLKKENAKAKPSAENTSISEVSDTVKLPVAHTDVCQNETDVPQAFSSLLLNIPDVDSADAGDAQICSEHVRDIYAYLQQLEVVMVIRPQVQREFKLRQETLFMTVSITDRFLQIMTVWQSVSLQTLAPVMQAVVRMLEKVTDQCKLQEIKSRYVQKYVKVSSSICKISSDLWRKHRF